MTEAFNNEPIYTIMALLGTLLFLIKMVLMIVGGDTDTDIDADVDGLELDDASHVNGAQSFTLVSIQSILAFFMGTGWIGLAARQQWGMDSMTSVFAAAGFGFLMMLMSSYLNMKIKGLNATPMNRIDKRAIGLTGRAYTDIPEKGNGAGQIEITVNGKQQILSASSEQAAIKAFTSVKVTFVDDSGNLTVTAI